MTAWTAATSVATAAQWALNAALAANPIGAVIVAVTALAAAGYEIYQHWTAIAAAIEKVAAAIARVAAALGGLG